MTQEITVGADNVVLDSEKLYLGSENPEESEKLVRKRPPLVRKFYSFQEWHDLRVMPFPVSSVHSAG